MKVSDVPILSKVGLRHSRSKHSKYSFFLFFSQIDYMQCLHEDQMVIFGGEA